MFAIVSEHCNVIVLHINYIVEVLLLHFDFKSNKYMNTSEGEQQLLLINFDI